MGDEWGLNSDTGRKMAARACAGRSYTGAAAGKHMWTARSPVTANSGLHDGQTVSQLNGSQEYVIPTLQTVEVRATKGIK